MFFPVKQVDESFLVDFGGCLFGCSLIFMNKNDGLWERLCVFWVSLVSTIPEMLLFQCNLICVFFYVPSV